MDLSIQAPSGGCHGHCDNATSVSVTVTSIEVHTSGIDNMTGEWTPVCRAQLPMSLNLSQIMNVTKNLCGAQIQPDSITNVRLNVSAATAEFPGQGLKTLTVPSGKLEIAVSPLADVQAGKTTAIFVELQPHVVCPGNGYDNCKLTPSLQATSSGPD